MKKLIALTLIAVCLAGFSLGCGAKKKEEPAKPAELNAPVDDDTTKDKGDIVLPTIE